MSIQNSINQTLAVAGALYSQSPTAETRKTAKLEKKELKQLEKREEGLNKAGDQALQKEMESLNQVDSLAKLLPNDSEWQEAAKKEKSEIMERGKNRARGMLQEQRDIAKRKGELTGDYKQYLQIDEFLGTAESLETKKKALERAETRKEFKRDQMSKLDKEQQDFINKMNPELKAEALRQLRGGKK